MSATEQGITFRGRWDDAAPELTEAQAAAVALFHNRTANQWSRVRDLALIGKYAESMGWKDIAHALIPAKV